VHYFLQDHLGSTRIIASASGAIEREADFYPFGGERVVGTATADDPHKFAGMWLDYESGLYHTWARMYDPSLGRWLAHSCPSRLRHTPCSDAELHHGMRRLDYRFSMPISGIT
jgi:RHS repeat-associated protein